MRLFVSALFVLFQFLAFADDKPFRMEYPYIHTFEYIGPGQIEIQQGIENKFIFKASKKVQNMFNLSYSKGVLKVELKEFIDLTHVPEIPHVVLIVNQLGKLILEGDNFVDIDSLKTDSFMVDIQINGSTMLEGNVHCEQFAITMVGSSQATIRGAARYQTIYINGPSLYDGKGFLTNDTNVRLLEASSCLVNVRKNLSISIEGFGHVHYLGDPTVSKSVKGEGVVSPAKAFALPKTNF